MLTGHQRNTVRIIHLDEIAEQIGLARGQGLADARAMCPHIEVFAEDVAADRRLLEAVADWCERYTPLVALDVPDGLILDITGCSHLFGGEKQLLHDLLARLFEQGFDAAAAIAATPGGAWAVGRFGPAAAIVPADATTSVLKSLPLAALRLDADILSGLARLGLCRIGQVLERPRAPLARRFGPILLRRLDQALGAEEESISPRLPVPELVAERRMLEPIGLVDDIERVCYGLATGLGTCMAKRECGARAIDLALFRLDGTVLRLNVGTARPVRDGNAIVRLLAERIAALRDDFDAGYGFDLIRLSIPMTGPLAPDQQSFAGAGDSDSDSDGDDDIALIADRLGARLGTDRVLASLARDTHLPERAERFAPVIGHLDGLARPAAINASAFLHPPARPLRIIDPPEPVETVAEVPEGPPRRFRWRRVMHEVTRADGPERIADEWWRAEHWRHTRDYFRIEDLEGRRFWLFREGLYESETAVPRWFLHGLFA